MENLSIKNREIFDELNKIKLYKDIFWESPWNEWFICKNCSSIYPKKFMWKCDCWNSNLEVFYKNSELKVSFQITSSKNGYQELVANILEEDVWFIWWWNTSIEELNDDKLWLTNVELNELESNIMKIYSDFDVNNFYYFAEIWVKKDYRWNDVAWNLYRQNLEKLKNKWEKFILVRTTRKSDVPYKWFKYNWYKDVFLYNDEQDRVILVYKI